MRALKMIFWMLPGTKLTWDILRLIPCVFGWHRRLYRHFHSGLFKNGLGWGCPCGLISDDQGKTWRRL